MLTPAELADIRSQSDKLHECLTQGWSMHLDLEALDAAMRRLLAEREELIQRLSRLENPGPADDLGPDAGRVPTTEPN